MGDIDYNALGQSMDTTFGRSSTPKTASYSVKLTLMGPDRVLASYAAIVTFASKKQMIELKRKSLDEAKAITNEVLKHVKGAYKDLTGSTVSFKELTSDDSLEITNMNVHNPRRTAYFRLKTVFEIG